MLQNTLRCVRRSHNRIALSKNIVPKLGNPWLDSVKSEEHTSRNCKLRSVTERGCSPTPRAQALWSLLGRHQRNQMRKWGETTLVIPALLQISLETANVYHLQSLSSRPGKGKWGHTGEREDDLHPWGACTVMEALSCRAGESWCLCDEVTRSHEGFEEWMGNAFHGDMLWRLCRMVGTCLNHKDLKSHLTIVWWGRVGI